jgi:hypothetical protein
MTVGAAKDGGYAYSAVSISRGFGNAQKSPPLEKPGSADLFSKSAAFIFLIRAAELHDNSALPVLCYPPATWKR